MLPLQSNQDIVQSMDAMRNQMTEVTTHLATIATNTTPITPAYFSAYQSVAVSLPAATFTKLLFQTEEYDSAGVYDASTSRFTAPVTGLYHISASFQCVSFGDTNRMIISLYKNGVEFRRGNRIHASTTDELQAILSFPVYLSEADYVEIYGWQNSAGAKNTSALPSQTYFSGYKVA